jgi:hypothetical protein
MGIEMGVDMGVDMGIDIDIRDIHGISHAVQ